MHQSSYDKMTYFKSRYLSPFIGQHLKIIDLGSQDVNGSYKDIFCESGWEYRGMDMIPGDNVDIVLKNPYSWSELKSDSIDVVVSGQALEHIEFFCITMLEVARVLKPGGICCIIAPSGGPEHRFPVDCWRFYKDGFKALIRFALLQEVEVFKQEKPEERYLKCTDSSNLWLDTVLICKKGRFPRLLSIRHKIWRAMAHKISLRAT